VACPDAAASGVTFRDASSCPPGDQPAARSERARLSFAAAEFVLSGAGRDGLRAGLWESPWAADRRYECACLLRTRARLSHQLEVGL